MLMIGAPLAALLAVSLWISFLSQRDDARRRMDAYLSKEAEFSAARFDTQLQMLSQIARSMASFLDSHADVTEPELYEMLRRNVGQSPLIYGSCVAFEPYTFEPGRRLFAPYVYKGPDKLPDGRDVDGLLRMDVADAYDYMDTKWDWFHGPRNTGGAMWTEPFFDEGAGDVVMCTYVAPFFRAGKFRGTVNIDVKLDDLQMVVRRMQSPAVSAAPDAVVVSIISRKGTFISWPEPEVIMHETVGSLAEKRGRPDIAELGRRMVAGRRGTERIMSFDPTPRPYVISYTPVLSTGWSFGVSLAEEDVLGPVYAELRDRALVAAALIAVIVGVTMGIGMWLTRPIERLAWAVKGVRLDGAGPPMVEVKSHDEIGDLGRAFNSMVGQLREQVTALTRETRARESVESELRIAREIQRSLLPRKFPPFPGRDDFDLHAFNGAARMVAGDFYDFFMLPDGRLAVVIADVCGKGISAAMFMAVVRTAVRNLALHGMPPGPLMQEANETLLEDNTRGLYVTMIVAFFDPRTGRITYANGGHPRPYVLSRDGGFRRFGRSTGTIVGVLENESWEEDEEQLEPGEALVMFTDGVTEARVAGGALFGELRLEHLLRGLASGAAAEISRGIVTTVQEFGGNDLADDVTLVVLRRNT